MSRIIISCTCVNALLQSSVTAQEFEFKCKNQSAGTMEILAEVLTPMIIQVKNLETGQPVAGSPWSVTRETNTFGDCDWVANVGVDTLALPEGTVILYDNTPYEIKIGNKVFTYFDCDGYNTSTEGFFCPNGGEGETDLWFDATDGNSVAVYQHFKYQTSNTKLVRFPRIRQEFNPAPNTFSRLGEGLRKRIDLAACG